MEFSLQAAPLPHKACHTLIQGNGFANAIQLPRRAPHIWTFAKVLGLALSFALALARAAPAAPGDGPCDGRAQCYAPPPGSGLFDVRDFGARGDGVADDGPAIRAALAAAETKGGTWTPAVYLPPGIYRVTDRIVKRDVKGNFDSGLMLRGAGSGETVIRLTDRAPGYGDPQAPRAVVFTSSHLWGQGGPYGGGKDWPQKGEGNQAFQNSLEGLTIDTGSGNPGAVALDYLANNSCVLRDVTLRDADGTGAIGLSMTRKWPGPCLIERLRVQGFLVGIDVARTTYSLTMLDLSLENSRRIGLRNNGNILSIANLSGFFPAVAIENAAPEGVVLLVGGRLAGAGGSAVAFRNRGILRVSGLRAEGFTDIGLAPIPGPLEDTVFEGSRRLAASGSATEVPPMPPVPDLSAADWTSVASFGAIPFDDRDDTAAFQAALDSGAAGIYIPFGTYIVSETLHPGPKTQRIAGMNAQLRARVRDDETPVLITGAGDLVIDNLRFSFFPMKQGGSPGTWIRHEGPGNLFLRDIFENALGYPSTVLDRRAGGGSAALANVCCGRLIAEGPSPVTAYHFNTEGQGTRILNRGANLLVLGIKTENVAEVVRTEAGGRTDILGGLLYPVRPVPPDRAAFVVANDAEMRATVSDLAFQLNQSYATLVATGDGRAIVPGCGTRSTMLGISWLNGRDLVRPAEAICR